MESLWNVPPLLLSSNGKVIIGTLLSVLILYYVFRVVQLYFRAAKLGKAITKIPSLPKHPLYGHLHQIPKNGAVQRFREIMTKDGFRRGYQFWMGPFAPSLTVVHPDIIKVLLKSSQPKRTPFDNNSIYTHIMQWLGDGLLVSSGNKWARNRRLITPAFHFEILKGYIPTYNSAADKLIENMSTMAAMGETVEVVELVSLCTLEVILKCAFSFEQEVQKLDERNQYVSTVNGISHLIMRRLVNPFLMPDLIWHLSPQGQECKRAVRFAHKVSEEVIAKRKKAMGNGLDTVKNKKYLDFLDILLSARDTDGQGLTDLEIRDEVDTFLFEGHDTTASGISWTLYSLAEHPEIQERVRKEVYGVCNSSDDLSWDDLNKLPYLTQCIKEAMRLWSPVPVISRQIDSDIELMGVNLPKGLTVNINIYSLHHNPDVWGDDHMDFNPDRMHIDNTKNMDSFAFIPFSAGSRNCIGQNFAMNEEKIIIAKVIRKFVLTVDPDNRPKPSMSVVMRANEGIKIKLTPVEK